MCKKHKKFCTAQNYIEHFLILASKITGCILISAFASLIDTSIGITSSAIALKIYAIATGIKMYKSIIKTKDKTVLLNGIEVLISKALVDSNISHDEFVLMNNVLKEYGNIKEEIKNLKT